MKFITLTDVVDCIYIFLYYILAQSISIWGKVFISPKKFDKGNAKKTA